MAERLADWLAGDSKPENRRLDDLLIELSKLLDARGGWVFTEGQEFDWPHLICGCLDGKGKYEPLDQSKAGKKWADRLGGYLDPLKTDDLILQPAKGLRIKRSSISHLLSLPLMHENVSVGTLMLAFDEEPAHTTLHLSLLRLAASRLARSMVLEDRRQPREILTLQANLSGLLAKIINPATDLNHLLTLTLEHTVLPLNASMGCIWLLGRDHAHLELHSSLLGNSRTRLPARIRSDQGLIGKVLETCQPLLSDTPAQHVEFDPDVDALWEKFGTLLMLPLHRHDTQFGVLCLGWERAEGVSDEERILIESMTDLVSAFMANINLIDQLSNYSTQQNALLEMSRQVALGLDLETTLARGLQWVTRLVGVEFGMLWLANDEVCEFTLGACLGSGLDDTQGYQLTLPEDEYWAWKDLLRPVMLRNPEQGSPFWLAYDELFGIQARDLIALPLESRGELMGIVILINRIGGLTLESEPAMLATAADMVALAVGNAQLHSRTLQLIGEKERAHALAIQATRLATVGRLTATLSHEINNPMQAIRGALSLAQEDLGDTESLHDYLAMSIQETDRVVDLIEKMRQVYLPRPQDNSPVQINDALQCVMVFAQKVSARQGVDIHMDLASDLIPIHSASDQIHLVLLSLILYLSDTVAAAGGDRIHIRSSQDEGIVRVEMTTQCVLNSVGHLFDTPESQPLTESAIRLAFSRDIIKSIEGHLEILSEGEDVIVSLELPAQVEVATELQGM